MTDGPNRREQLTNSIGLLISILVRYPEVATIKFEPKLQTLSFTFLLRALPDLAARTELEALMRDSLAAYQSLEQISMETLTLSLSADEDVGLLEITRDVASLTQGELALIVDLIVDRFGDALIVDDGDSGLEDDYYAQDELIRTMLADLQDGQPERNLIAFRDGGRVLVYNK
jgi:hypothetical protein